MIAKDHKTSLFINERTHIYNELRYEYYRMEIPCPLCKCMINRLRIAQHHLSKEKKVSGNSGYRLIKTTKPITYRRDDGTYENKNYDFYTP